MNISLKSICWTTIGMGLLMIGCTLLYLTRFDTQRAHSTLDFGKVQESLTGLKASTPIKTPKFAGLFVNKLFSSSCQPQGDEFLEQELLFSEDGSISMTDRFYSHSNCQAPSIREIQRQGHYHLAEEEHSKLLLSVRSLAVIDVKIAPQSIEQTQIWNQQEHCGLNHWENQKSQSVGVCEDIKVDRGSYYEALAQLKGNTLALEHSLHSSWIYQAKLLSSH